MRRRSRGSMLAAVSRHVGLVAMAMLLPGCAPGTRPEQDDVARDDIARDDVAPATQRDAIERPELGRHFGDVVGSFVLLDTGSGDVVRYNPERARTRFLPASTFKIPHTLIALETGAVDGAETLLTRDTLRAPAEAWWPASWLRDHTLATALPNSVVWYYQETARRIGHQRMQDHVDRFDYGNRDISGGIDQFWLTGGLAISPDEQVEFLRRFHQGELGVSERSTRIVKELLVLEETPDYRLSGKTGWAGLGEADAPDVGWLVGYLERGAEVYYYATNVEIRTPQDAQARLAITRSILEELGLLGPYSRDDGTPEPSPGLRQ